MVSTNTCSGKPTHTVSSSPMMHSPHALPSKVDKPISDNLSNCAGVWYRCDTGAIFHKYENSYHGV